VEKWNGRFFQKGGLWQVGIKIYLGHDGKPCPRSTAALTGLNEFTQANKNDGGDIIGQVATQIGIPTTDVLQTISEALDQPDGSIMNEMEKRFSTPLHRRQGRVSSIYFNI
jgi:uncharacterized protein (DUF2126 family)